MASDGVLPRSQSLVHAVVLAVVFSFWITAASSLARAEEQEAAPPASDATSFDEELLFEDTFGVAEPDPLEPVNRGVFLFNRGLEWLVLKPVARSYGFLMPEPGERAVRHFFTNLNAPVVLVNDLLQLEGRYALVTTSRFVINSTLGLAGLFDPAHRLGFASHTSDFGETLARVGVASGPYLVLPLLGPTTARDGLGRLIDGLLKPQTYLLGSGELLLLGAGDGIATFEKHREAWDTLKESSIDFYAAVRSAYFMYREAQLHEDDRAPADLALETQQGLEASTLTKAAELSDVQAH